MMKILELYTATETADAALTIDLLLETEGNRERVNYEYRVSDRYSPVTSLITQWLQDNPDQEILPYIPPPEPTPEELRQLMPPISKRQLRLTLVRNGSSLSELDAAIETMGDEAIIEWNDSSEYRRLNPLLNQVADHLELSQDQVDAMWQQALEA